MLGLQSLLDPLTIFFEIDPLNTLNIKEKILIEKFFSIY